MTRQIPANHDDPTRYVGGSLASRYFRINYVTFVSNRGISGVQRSRGGSLASKRSSTSLRCRCLGGKCLCISCNYEIFIIQGICPCGSVPRLTSAASQGYILLQHLHEIRTTLEPQRLVLWHKPSGQSTDRGVVTPYYVYYVFVNYQQ